MYLLQPSCKSKNQQPIGPQGFPGIFKARKLHPQLQKYKFSSRRSFPSWTIFSKMFPDMTKNRPNLTIQAVYVGAARQIRTADLILTNVVKHYISGKIPYFCGYFVLIFSLCFLYAKNYRPTPSLFWVSVFSIKKCSPEITPGSYFESTLSNFQHLLHAVHAHDSDGFCGPDAAPTFGTL